MKNCVSVHPAGVFLCLSGCSYADTEAHITVYDCYCLVYNLTHTQNFPPLSLLFRLFKVFFVVRIFLMSEL